LLKTIQSEENSFQVPRSLETKERLKTGRKHKKSYQRGCLRRPCTWRRVKNPFCLFFKLDRRIKAQFSSLNP